MLITYNLRTLFKNMAYIYNVIVLISHFSSEGIWLSGKTLDCRPRDWEFDPPSLQLNLLKGDMYWFFPGKMLLCISALHWAR